MRRMLVISALLVWMAAGSGTASAQVLDTPQLLSPENGSIVYGVVGQVQAVTLTWASVPNALSYEVSANAGSITDTIEVGTTYYVNPRQILGQWNWQVKAKGAEGTESAWSEIWTYELKIELPTPTPEGFPKLDLSGDEDYGYEDFFLFYRSWGAENADGEYDYQADLATDGKIDEKDLLLMAKAWNDRDSVMLAAPSLLAPASGAFITFVQARDSGLNWGAVPQDGGSMSYNIMVEHRQGLWPTVDELVDGTTYSFKSTVTGLYDWKVRGRDRKTLLFGPWSELRSFTLQGQPTPTP